MPLENRKFKRSTPLKEIYISKNGIDIELGFICDISRAGVKLFIDANEMKSIDSIFTFKLSLPKKLGSKSIDIQVREAWKTKELHYGYQEIGCYFENCSETSQDKINKLVELYENIPPLKPDSS